MRPRDAQKPPFLSGEKLLNAILRGKAQSNMKNVSSNEMNSFLQVPEDRIFMKFERFLSEKKSILELKCTKSLL